MISKYFEIDRKLFSLTICNNLTFFMSCHSGIIFNSIKVKDLTPQVINAARVVFANPDNTAAIEHFDLLKKQWSDNMDKLRGLMDEAVDSRALINAQGTLELE